MARLADTVLLPTPPLPELTAMMFFTSGSSFSTSGRGADLNSVPIFTSTSSPSFSFSVASADLTVDLINGSVSRGKMSEKLTELPLMRRLSATMPLSTRFFFVPG